MTILTPADVAERMQCSNRRAFDYMRQAGAIPCGKDSLRITDERFDEWLSSATYFEPKEPDIDALAARFVTPDVWGRVARGALRENFVYFLTADSRHVKIGYSGDVEARRQIIQSMQPTLVVVLAAMRGGVRVEREMHERFSRQREHGEWFRREGALAHLLKAAA